MTRSRESFTFHFVFVICKLSILTDHDVLNMPVTRTAVRRSLAVPVRSYDVLNMPVTRTAVRRSLAVPVRSYDVLNMPVTRTAVRSSLAVPVRSYDVRVSTRVMRQ
jgi:hypothetical protein